MTRYNKGATAERELMGLFSEKNYSVARIAGSGKNRHDCPDIICMKNNKALIIECKAHNKTRLYITNEQIKGLTSWNKQGGVPIVAWKYPRKGWKLFSPEKMTKTKKGYSISIDEATRNHLHLLSDENNQDGAYGDN